MKRNKVPFFTGRLFVLSMLISLVLPSANAGPLRDLIKQFKSWKKGDESPGITGASEKNGAMPQGVKILRDFSYGSDDEQRIDVYIPENARSAPVIFMVHGGAWVIGDKKHAGVVQNKAERWLPHGFIFISVNYRLRSVNPLEQAKDVASALAMAQRQAAVWGGDPAKFILMGHSAGAHLVALLAANPSMALTIGAQPWLGSVLLDTAALDVVKIMETRHPPLYDRAFGKEPTFWPMVSPIHQLSASAFPMLAVCSTRRENSCSQGKVFSEKAVSLGINVKVLEQNLSHGEINKNLGMPGDFTQSVEEFMKTLAPEVMEALKK